MERYKVTDPNGVLLGGKRIAEGELLPATSTTSQIKAWLRFEQIEKVKVSETEEAEPAQDPQHDAPDGTVPEAKKDDPAPKQEKSKK